MNKPVVENFLSWKGLPTLLTIVTLLIGLIIYVSRLDSRIGFIEKDHMTFGAFYQKQIDEIKAGIIRIEDKLGTR